MRQFIRHPTDIPIRLEKQAGAAGESTAEVSTSLQNISHGGLCCITSRPFAIGEKVTVSILLAKPPFSSNAEVMWCRYAELGYEIGLHFLNAEDAYAVRMVEQVCHIEHYKREAFINEGRTLTGEQAAAEWIMKFASGFPGAATPDMAEE